jgi:hypothetical protein
LPKSSQQAGVAFADGTGSGSSTSVCSGTGRHCGDPPQSGTGTIVECQHCANQLHLDICYCTERYDATGYDPNPTMWDHCTNQATMNAEGCRCCWCTGNAPKPNNACPPVGQSQPPQGCNC